MKSIECLRIFLYKRKKLVLRIIIPSIIVITFIIFKIIGEPEDPISHDIQILKSDESLSKVTNDVKTHNYNLLSLLAERKIPEESGLIQARTIYFGIIAIILSLILSPSPEKQEKQKFPIFVILLSLITLMYALDVHLKDFNHRQKIYASIVGKEIERVINWIQLIHHGTNTIMKKDMKDGKKLLKCLIDGGGSFEWLLPQMGSNTCTLLFPG